jgi:imidazolonepropionase
MPAADIPALVGTECAAVLLPGAEFIGAEHTPPARELADAGVVCALATDLNPGTSPIVSLPLIAGLAVRRYGWTVKEALLALTLNAAWVIGRSRELGALTVGRRADVLLLDCPAGHIPYRFGHNPVAAVLVAGVPVWVREDHRWRFEGSA